MGTWPKMGRSKLELLGKGLSLSFWDFRYYEAKESAVLEATFIATRKRLRMKSTQKQRDGFLMTSAELLTIVSEAGSPPLNFLVMWVTSHFCLVSLNWASFTHHQRNPDRFRPCHTIFHEKRVPASLLAERRQVTMAVNPHTLAYVSLVSWLHPSMFLIPSLETLTPLASSAGISTLFGSPSLLVEPTFSEWGMHILCRAIGQMQHFFWGGRGYIFLKDMGTIDYL